MPFPREQVDELLKACHRRCCVCHRFCGVKIETDHIVTKADGGPDSIDNAIPVCFECHAEIHSYNDKHPRGRKFRPEELRGHREQWLEICRTKPEIFVSATRDSDVGPIQALIDELEFNLEVSQHASYDALGCLFLDEQFRRAIRDGAIATLDDSLKKSILEAYRILGRANEKIRGAMAALGLAALMREMTLSEDYKAPPYQLQTYEMLCFGF
ncbi:MAG TPA: hypothetical protein DC047_01280 [Blastocatellia bacterium]|nr:hypothetical protein [Blastocatellia bacterium]